MDTLLATVDKFKQQQQQKSIKEITFVGEGGRFKRYTGEMCVSM